MLFGVVRVLLTWVFICGGVDHWKFFSSWIACGRINPNGRLPTLNSCFATGVFVLDLVSYMEQSVKLVLIARRARENKEAGTMLDKQRRNNTGKIHKCKTYKGIVSLVTTHSWSKSPWLPAREVQCVMPSRSGRLSRYRFW